MRECLQEEEEVILLICKFRKSMKWRDVIGQNVLAMECDFRSLLLRLINFKRTTVHIALK